MTAVPSCSICSLQFGHFAQFFFGVHICLLNYKINYCNTNTYNRSPICEDFIFTYISQRKFVIKVIHYIFGVSYASNDLVSLESRCLQFLVVEVLPVDRLEPRIVLQGHISGTSQSTLRLIFVQELLHKLSSFLVLQGTRIFQLQIEYFLIYFQWIFRLLSKRNISTHKLEHVNAKRIKTHSKGISFANDDLWSHIMRRPNEREGLSCHDIPPLYNLGGHEIDEFQVSLSIHHEVFGFQITHDDSLSCEVFQSEDHGGNVKLSIFSTEQTNLSDCIVQLFALDELHQRVKIIFIFETLIVLHDKRMIQTSQQIFFLRNVFEQGMLLDFLFAVCLENIEFLLFHLVETSNKQNRTKLSLLKLLEQDQLVEAVYKFIPFLDLFVKSFCLPFFILFNDGVHEASDDLFYDIGLDLSNDTIRLHYYVIFISSLSLIFQKKFLAVNLRSDSYGINVFVFFESSFNNNYYLLIIDIFCVLFDDYVSCFVTIDLHQIQNFLYLLFRQFRQVSTLLY